MKRGNVISFARHQREISRLLQENEKSIKRAVRDEQEEARKSSMETRTKYNDKIREIRADHRSEVKQLKDAHKEELKLVAKEARYKSHQYEQTLDRLHKKELEISRKIQELNDEIAKAQSASDRFNDAMRKIRLAAASGYEATGELHDVRSGAGLPQRRQGAILSGEGH